MNVRDFFSRFHLFTSFVSEQLGNICSVYSVIFRNTSIRIDIGFILSHLCVKLNFMHSLSYDTNDAHHWKSFVKWFYIYCSHTRRTLPECVCMYCFFFSFVVLSFNISSNGSPSWCERFRFCATFWFEAIWFCVLYTPLPQNKHRVITPIQLKWMDCYEMICVNPKTTINEMFCVVSLHTISVCLFFVIRWN